MKWASILDGEPSDRIVSSPFVTISNEVFVEATVVVHICILLNTILTMPFSVPKSNVASRFSEPFIGGGITLLVSYGLKVESTK
jgi:hypothetical protein